MDKATNDFLAAFLAAAAANGAPKGAPHKSIREQAAERGKVIMEAYKGFQDAGFNEHQAFKLVLTIIN